MWPFSKKKKKEEASDDDDEEEDEEEKKPAEDQALSQRVEMMGADLTKINGTLESFKEARKSTNERFSTMNEQIGEMRGMITDVQRTVGMIEVKATKAADLVDSVQPDKLMIQVQKEDGKIEGLRGMLEAKEEMMKNIVDQLRKMRDQMKVFRSVDQVIKLNEEVKDEIMTVKKIVAEVERHADRVDNVFIESQKSFESFNTFADKLEDLKAEQKEAIAKLDKVEVATGTFIKKADFEGKIEKIEKNDKKVKKFLDDTEGYFKKMDDKFMKMESKVKGEFQFKIQKAEILSKAFEDLLTENPLFSDGLRLQEYLNKHMKVDPKALKEVMHEQGGGEASAEAGGDGGEGGDGEKKEGDGGDGEKKEGEGGDEKKEADGEKKEGDGPDKKMTEGMTAVKK